MLTLERCKMRLNREDLEKSLTNETSIENFGGEIAENRLVARIYDKIHKSDNIFYGPSVRKVSMHGPTLTPLPSWLLGHFFQARPERSLRTKRSRSTRTLRSTWTKCSRNTVNTRPPISRHLIRWHRMQS